MNKKPLRQSLFLLCEELGVDILVPSGPGVAVIEVLFEASELLLDQYTSSVVEVVGQLLVQVLTSVPLIPAVFLHNNFLGGVEGSASEQDHAEPEGPILLEEEFFVVIHWVRRLVPVEVIFIGGHVGLEFDGVFG